MPIHIAIPEPSSYPAVPDSTAYNQRALPQYLHALIAAGATPIVIPLHETPQRVAKILSTVQGILLPGSPADIDPQKYGESPNPHTAPPDNPRSAVDELLLQDAFNLHKPIFAICQGLQSLNTWLNGALIQDIPSQTGAAVNHAPERTVLEAHPIQITPNTRLASLVPHEDANTPKNCHPERNKPENCHPERSEGPAEVSVSAKRSSDGLAFKIDHPHSMPFPLHETPAHLCVNSSHHQAIRAPGDNLIVSAISPEDGIIEAVELASPSHFVLAVQWHPERTYDVSAFSRNLFHAFVHQAETWTPRRIEDSVFA